MEKRRPLSFLPVSIYFGLFMSLTKWSICIFTIAVSTISCVRSPAGYLAKGNQFFEQGKFADASLNYRKAIQLDAKLGEAYYRLALSSVKEKKPADVLPNLTRAAQLSPKDSAIQEALGDLLLSLYLQDSSRPKAWYEQLSGLSRSFLESNPRSVQGHRIEGYLAFLESKPKEALVHFESAAKVEPDRPELGLMIAESQYLDGNRQEGERQARAVLDAHPDYAAAYDFLYRQLESDKRYNDAEALLKQKRAKNPGHAEYAIGLAEHYQRHGRVPERDAVTRETLQNLKSSDDALLVGDFEVGAGDWNGALDALKSGLQKYPGKAVEYLTRISAILVDHHQAQAALQLVEPYAATGKEPELKALRASLVIEAGRIKQEPVAMGDLLELEKQYPKNAILHYQLGRADLLQGKLNDAQREFREAVKQNGRFLEPRLSLVQISLDTRQYFDALRQCDDLLSAIPDLPAALVLRAASLTGLGRFEEARAALKTAHSKTGEEAGIAVELGFLSLAEKKFAEAERIFRQRYQPGAGDLRPLAGLVAALGQQGKPEAAAAIIRQDLNAGPDRPFVTLMLAQVTAAKNPDEAVDQLRGLIQSKPEFSPALMALGELYLRQDQPEKAIAYLERARNLNPTNAAPLVLLSGALERAHQEYKARQVYQAWLKLEPDNPVALNNLAYLQSETGGDLDGALQLAKHALARSPKDANISDTIGWIYLKKRMYPSAESVFHQITQQYPNNASFRLHSALSYLGSGDRTKAKSELQLALASNPPREIETQIKQALNQLQVAR